MSLQFNDTALYKGIVQIYEKECGFDRGTISGDDDKLKELAADVNLAFDDLLAIGFKTAGTWQLDDSNQQGYPILYTDIVLGRRDYEFIQDNRGNLILDIFRVFVAGSDGVYREITPKDQQTRNSNNSDTDRFTDGRNTTGRPTSYDKTARGIFLDFVPNYNLTDGIKVMVNREGTYFLYSDTTKKAGVPGNLHRYLAIKPALDYARRKSLANYSTLLEEVIKFEGHKELNFLDGIIADTFGRRERDIPRRLVANVENNK